MVDNALRDAAWFLHQSGLSGGGYFRKGEWTVSRCLMAELRKAGVEQFENFCQPCE
ncbi:hypothetical protein SBA6_70043 [Candidatus Sulfopaludibacter sp. SbA6]|nr:hypothetical protein SBA6_70043 [Candidatus Sulfopaludibacter sp. SbA6]